MNFKVLAVMLCGGVGLGVNEAMAQWVTCGPIASKGVAARFDTRARVDFRLAAGPIEPLARARAVARVTALTYDCVNGPGVATAGAADDTGWGAFGSTANTQGQGVISSLLLSTCQIYRPGLVPEPGLGAAYASALVDTFSVGAREYGLAFDVDATSLAGEVTIERRRNFPGGFSEPLDESIRAALELGWASGSANVSFEGAPVESFSVDLASDQWGFFINCTRNSGGITLAAAGVTRISRELTIHRPTGPTRYVYWQQVPANPGSASTISTFPFSGTSGSVSIPADATGFSFVTRDWSDFGDVASAPNWLLDVNGDGVLTQLDRIALVDLLGGTLTTGNYSLAGDFNLDLAVDLADYSVLAERLLALGGCVPDLDGDGVVTGADFVVFTNAFADGSLVADVCGIGGVGTASDGLLTGDDFAAFLSLFAAGCP